MSLEFRKLLALPDKGVSLTNDPLARLFRKMLFDIGFNEGWADGNMREYLNDPTNMVPHDSSARSSARGNLFKELASDKMTFNVLKKAFKFLRPLKVDVTFEVHWTASRTTKHTIEIPVMSIYAMSNGQDLNLEDILPDQIDAASPGALELVSADAVSTWRGKRKVHHSLPDDGSSNDGYRDAA